MRTIMASGVVAMLAVGLSGCAVVSAGSTVVGAGASVAATLVGTTADIAGDVISAPFGSTDSDRKKD
jgi:hypothetical protein